MEDPPRPHAPTRKATASDVAREADVSKWTVNRAFRSDASIAPDSRARILDVAARLGYRPNMLARSLSTKSTQQVAVLVDDFGNPHKLQMMSLLTAALQRDNLVAVLININATSGHVEAMLNADQRQVDAIVLLGTAFQTDILQHHTRQQGGPPLFVIGRESDFVGVTAVSCDPAVSMTAIGLHLWGRGYRRPGFLSGPRTLSTALGRKHHFAAFWRERGIANVPELMGGSYDREPGSAAVARYLAETPPGARFDVLMCENDALAFWAMDVVRSGYGLRIPGDLAVVGYDGSDLAGHPAYGLTTYEQPMAEMVDQVVSMIVGRIAPHSHNLPGRLLVRQST
ncbi:substrate-binding domain-containing protein [Lichenihabitans sp. Uapishka_5]|uniref:LacI family DNA-binding transcriptional regulator n=1 Tax=Lichenihabitans sp. Uapishka_5 TaxID=3037302 RepID=UPI0029E7F9C3|nr:substrate-binding domain-containing protein [Lichenihabitans sp. Uapishka_5]MDX7949568.1 substrate-binding domain-containing protein [Lichenihabitans sp. Uapishka_5]